MLRQPDTLTAQLAADYVAGATLRQLGRRYHYSHTKIATLLERAGVPRRRAGRRTRICPVCGQAVHARRIYCSDGCQRAAGK